MKQEFTILFNQDNNKGSLRSFSSWVSLKSVFEQHFKTRDCEVLTGIIVNDEGITALFEYKK